MAQQQGPETAGKPWALLAPLAGLAAGVALIMLSLMVFVYAQGVRAGQSADVGDHLPARHQRRHAGQYPAAAARHPLAFFFKAFAKLRGRANALQAGTYDFPKGASMMDVLKQIEDGRVVRLVVTIPEGKTSAQAVRILMAETGLTGDVDIPPEGRHPARYLPVPARRSAPGGARPHAGSRPQDHRRVVGQARAGPAAGHQGRRHYPGFDRRARDGPAVRTSAPWRRCSSTACARASGWAPTRP